MFGVGPEDGEELDEGYLGGQLTIEVLGRAIVFQRSEVVPLRKASALYR
jgi:hypothetical protein